MNKQIKHIKNLIDKHNEFRSNCINLMPSENVLSPLARKALQSDMGQRYYFENAYMREEGASYSYRGTKYVKEILETGQKVAQDLFNAEYVSLYPISGHLANIALLFAFTKPGDTIMCIDPLNGGYPGLDKNKLPKYLNLNVRYFPMRDDIPELIDEAKTNDHIHKYKPKLIIFSSANTLFPIHIEGLIESSKKNNTIIIYDASHPLGLIVGNKFQDPLKEGADVLVGGTQKSFPGPQGAIIATNKYVDEVKSVEHFVMVDNPHFHRIAALTLSMLEMKHYGKQYASQVIKNAKHLALYLHSSGLPVCYKEHGFTESHMFKIKVFSEYSQFTENLEKANIIIDNSSRVGVNEITRLGMKEKEVKIIAGFINDIKMGVNPEIVKENVIIFMQKHKIVSYK